MGASTNSGSGRTAAWWAATAIIVAGIAVTGYAWLGGGDSRRPVGPPERITLAASFPYAGSSLIQLAKEKDFFAAEGVDLTIEPYVAGRLAQEALLAGKADLATVADLPIVHEALKGAPLLIVATLATSASGYSIVARKDRGIASPKDLKGKRLGLTSGTSGHYWVDAFLIRQHLTIADVKVQSFPPDKLAAAIAAGEVDAVSTWEPFLSDARKALGGNALAISADGIYDSPWNLVTRRDVAARRPEAIRRFLRALLRAERFYSAQPEAALALIAKARQTEVETLRPVLAGFRFDMRLGQSLLGTLEDETRWAIRSKLTESTKVPNFLEHLYADALLAVKPEAVTVIR